MEQLLNQVLSEYGLPTAFLGVMIFLFLKFAEYHKNERDEWRTDSKEISRRLDDTQKETNAVIRELTIVIKESSKH